MAVRVAITGFGRIGRNALRATYDPGPKDVEVVGNNDLGPIEINAHLLRYGPVHCCYCVTRSELNNSYKPVSNASCATDCLAPVVAVLNHAVDMDHGFMKAIHAYTGDQPVLDTLHRDRAAALVLPEGAGELDGRAIRAPTPNVSMSDGHFLHVLSRYANEWGFPNRIGNIVCWADEGAAGSIGDA